MNKRNRKNNFWACLNIVRRRNKGSGWNKIKAHSLILDYGFECRDCGGQVSGLAVRPKFCPYCGKEHG